jgi:hypothetical protein
MSMLCRFSGKGRTKGTTQVCNLWRYLPWDFSLPFTLGICMQRPSAEMAHFLTTDPSHRARDEPFHERHVFECKSTQEKWPQ